MFGQITPLSTATKENALSLNQPKTSFKELLDEPELVAIIQTGYKDLRYVTCLNEDKIWTSGETNDIKCFNIKGSLFQTIKTKSGNWRNDIAVDSDGDLLYSDCETKTVNIVKNGQIEELIRSKGWKPVNMCITSTGDLLVTMYSDNISQSKVVRYSGSTEKQTIQFDEEGNPLYSGNSAIKYITENRNHDICVADWEAGVVVVVNQDGKLRWRYTGHPSATKIKPFRPRGITTDSQSRILTADCRNHCIHIVDQIGQNDGIEGIASPIEDNPYVDVGGRSALRLNINTSKQDALCIYNELGPTLTTMVGAAEMGKLEMKVKVKEVGTDRSNIVQIADLNDNFPMPFERSNMWNNANIRWIYHGKTDVSAENLAVTMASAGYYRCVKKLDCPEAEHNNYIVETKTKMNNLLNNAPASFQGAVLRFQRGIYHYMSTRNNNFSNRSQKSTITVV
uniref:Uncharacterized protein n=1 Tax=Magallana gigas TaxID=29159 RepID=K1PSU0_MAGGI